jgi:hypothetical protein
MRRYNRGHLGTGLTARRCWCWSQHLAAGLLVTGHASLLVYCSGGMCLRGSPIATQTETQTHLASQPRAAVDAVVPRVVGARRSAASACRSTCRTTSRPSPACVPGAARQASHIAHVRSTRKLCGHAQPCGGPTQRRTGLVKALKKASSYQLSRTCLECA